MLSPDRPTVVTAGDDLGRWFDRCFARRSAKDEYHLVHRDARITVHPARVVRVEKGGRQIVVKGTTGRGWKPKLVSGVIESIDSLDAGGGEAVKATLGDHIREAIALGADPKPEAERTHWFEWLKHEELTLLLGAWMHVARVLGARIETSRLPSLKFHPTNEEFDYGVDASNAANLYAILHRLAIARGAPTEPK